MSRIDPTHAAPEIHAEAPTVVRQNVELSPSVQPTEAGGEATGSGDKTVISRRPAMDAPIAGTPAETASVLVGRRLDHFVLEELIGGGGMGAVFRARDTRLDRIVAVKVLPRVGQDPDLLRRFRVEAQSAARLDHPNIARIYDVGQQDGWHYIVFEHIEGINIRDLVHRQGVLSVDQSVLFVYQTAEALQHAWKRGVVHRDVKPSNLLVDTSGHVKLVDMGLARSQAVELSDDLTASNVTLGTFDYISPEQARDPRIADVRSDLYSLGCTLYFMLAGQPPYPGGTVVQKLLSHGSSPPPDLRLIRPDVSDDLVAILFKLLSKQPDYRYQEPVDLMADLAELARRERLPFSHSTDFTVTRPAQAKWLSLWHYHLPWMAAVGMMLTSIIGLKLASPVNIEPPAPPEATQTSGTAPSIPAVPPVSLAPSDLPKPPLTPAAPTTSATGSTGTSPGAVPSSIPAMENGSTTTAGPINAPSVLPPTGAPVTSINPQLATTPSVIPSAAGIASAAASTLAGTASTNAAMKTIRVVRQTSPAVPVGQDTVTTIEEAFRRAAALPQVETIEIDDDKLFMGRVRVPRSGLTLKAATGRRPMIYCDDADAPQMRMQRPAIIRTSGFGLRIEDLGFHWTVRNSARDGGTLFSLIGGEELTLTRCNITIENTTLREPVCTFELLPELTAELNPQGAATRVTSISMQDSFARGQMSLINMDYSVPVKVKLTNSLIAASGRLLEAGGTDWKDPVNPVQISLDLNHVTAFTNGLVLVRTGPSGKYAPFLQRHCDQCVLFGGTSALAMIEFANLNQLPQAVVPWNVSGEGNVYASNTEALVRATTVMGDQRQWRLSEVSEESWYQERRPKFGISVKGVWPVDEPFHVLETGDLDIGDTSVGYRPPTEHQL